MSQVIYDGLYTKLTAVQTAGSLYAAVSGRIYDTQKPQGANLPCLVYRVVESPVTPYFGGKTLVTATVEFDIFGPLGDSIPGGGNTYLQDVGEIEAKLFALLQGFDLTVTGHDRGQCTIKDHGTREFAEAEPAWVQTSTYEIRSFVNA